VAIDPQQVAKGRIPHRESEGLDQWELEQFASSLAEIRHRIQVIYEEVLTYKAETEDRIRRLELSVAHVRARVGP